MKPARTLKTVQTALLVAGIALTMACGYSHSMTPATAGNMPMIISLNQTTVTHGVAVSPFVASGTNFDAGINAAFITITFNGTSTKMTTQVGGTAAASTATTMIPMGFFTTAGTAQITVTNPGTPGRPGYGGGTNPETSAPMSLTVN